MFEPRYEAYPNIFGVRPFASLLMLTILVIGFLLVPAGRFVRPEVLQELLPGGLAVDAETLQYIGIGLFALAGVVLYVWYATSRCDRLLFMPEGIIWRHGFLVKHTTEIRFDAVRSLQLDQTPLQRLLNAGDLTIYTEGDAPQLVMRGLRYPQYIRTLIESPETVPAAAG